MKETSDNLLALQEIHEVRKIDDKNDREIATVEKDDVSPD